MNTTAPQKNRMFFTIRDLFWLVLVVAVAVRWWQDRSVREAYHQQELEQIAAEALNWQTEMVVEKAKRHNLRFAIKQLDETTQAKIYQVADDQEEGHVYEPIPEGTVIEEDSP